MDNDLEAFYERLDKEAKQDGEVGENKKELVQLALEAGLLEEIDKEEYLRKLDDIPF